MVQFFQRNIYLVSVTTTMIMVVLLLSLRWSNPTTARWIDQVFQTVVYPFQTAFTTSRNSISEWYSNYVALVDLKAENERLGLENQALREELNHSVNSSIQFNLLREQLKFLEERPERKVFAEVIGESSDNLHHVLLINKGRNSGIRRNFPVVLRDGVVGRIQSVSAFSAVVQLIVDRRHRFPVLVRRSRERMVMRGKGGGLELKNEDRGVVFGIGDGLKMNRIRMLADIREGDQVITSGLAGIFPKGLMVGTVVNVTRKRHELFQKAEIRAVVDFNKIEGVFVIVREKRIRISRCSRKPLHHVLLINKGRNSGIRRNFPVVLRDGVVGRIQSVSAFSAVVQLIVDRRHRFPVLVRRSRERMVMRGKGGGLELKNEDRGVVFGIGDGLKMNRIRMLADIREGDQVITSGLAGIFPKGLMVGTVVNVTRKRHELFQKAEIRAVVDFNKIEGVFVIVREKKDPNFPMFTEK